MKPIATLTDDGDLRIDLAHLMSYDDGAADALFARLAAHATFAEDFVTRLIDHVVSGATEDGDWWSTEMAENVRRRLLPHAEDAIAELVADLVCQRDRAVEMSDRWRNSCWRIAEFWDSMDRERCRKERQPDYHVARTMTADEARTWMRVEEKRIRSRK